MPGLPEKTERNKEIWLRHCNGESQASLCEEYGLSRPTLANIVRRERMRAKIENKEELVVDLVAELERNREVLAEIRDEDSPPEFDIRGTVLRDDDGTVVRSRANKMAATKEMANQIAHMSKLLGLNAPDRQIVDQTVRYEFAGDDDEV